MAEVLRTSKVLEALSKVCDAKALVLYHDSTPARE